MPKRLSPGSAALDIRIDSIVEDGAVVVSSAVVVLLSVVAVVEFALETVVVAFTVLLSAEDMVMLCLVWHRRGAGQLGTVQFSVDCNILCIH